MQWAVECTCFKASSLSNLWVLRPVCESKNADCEDQGTQGSAPESAVGVPGSAMAAGFEMDNILGATFSGGDLVIRDSCLYAPSSNGVTRTDLEHASASYLPVATHRSVRSIACSPSSSLLLCIDESGGAVLSTQHNGVPLHRIQLSASHASVACFSPTGNIIAISAGRELQLWRPPETLSPHMAPLRRLQSYGGFADSITCAAFSSDGNWIAAGSLDMSVRVFSAEHIFGYSPPVLSGHRSHIVGVHFSNASANTLLVVTADGALISWECTSPSPSTQSDSSSSPVKLPPRDGRTQSSTWEVRNKHLFGQNKSLTSVSFNPSSDGSLLILAGFAHGVFTLHRMPGFERLQGMSASSRAITSTTFGKNGDWLALGCETLGQVLVWEWRTEQYILKQQSHALDVNSCSLSSGGSLVATGGNDCKVKIWDARSGTSFATFSGGLELPVSCVRFLPSGNAVLASCLDGTVRAFDLLRYRNFRKLVAPEQCNLSALAVDPSGEIVAAGSSDGFKLYTWSLKSGKLLEAFGGHDGPISSMSFSPTAPSLATGSWDSTVRVWDVFEGKGNVEVLDHQNDVLAVSHSPDGKLLAVATLNAQITLWNPSEGQFKGLIDGRRDIKGGKISYDKRSLANASSSSTFSTLSFSADSSLLLAGGNSKHLCMYDIKALTLIARFVISSNRALEGVLDQLPSYELTEAGPTSVLPAKVSEEDDIEGPISGELMPGTEGFGTTPGTTTPAALFKKNKRSAPARCRCVAFSPTGRSFVAATTEGVLQYSKAAGITSFEPVDLGEDATPSTVNNALVNKQYSLALVLSLRLNEEKWIKAVLEHIPPDSVFASAQLVPSVHARRFVEVVASFIETSRHLEHAVSWMNQFCLAHGAHAERYMPAGIGPAWRAATKALSRVHDDLSATASSNLYALKHISSAPVDKDDSSSISIGR